MADINLLGERDDSPVKDWGFKEAEMKVIIDALESKGTEASKRVLTHITNWMLEAYHAEGT